MTAALHLSDEHRAQLEASAIDASVIEERGYRSERSPHIIAQLEPRFTKAQHRAGLLIPAYRLGKPEPYAYTLRPDTPRTPGKGAKVIKYEHPKGIPACYDVLPRFRPALGDPAIELWITEGTKKADSLASHGIVAISLSGVYGWRGRNDDGGKLLLPDIEEVAWNGRRVVLAFDSDVIRKAQVQKALNRYRSILTGKEANVSLLHLPDRGDSKTGVDDFLARLRDKGASHEERLDELRSLIEPGSFTFHIPLEKAFLHPTTGEQLYNPQGYTMAHGRLTYSPPTGGASKHIYAGLLAPERISVDAETDERYLTIRFGRSRELEGTVTAPQKVLSTAQGVIKELAAKGAPVHDGNARDVARYISEFVAENKGRLPHGVVSRRLGGDHEGLVGPGWSVGRPASYVGPHNIRLGRSGDEYRAAAEQLLRADAWVPGIVMGLAAASPFLHAFHPRRNPVVWIHGPSNSGKSTLLQFAIAVYGPAQTRPFASQAARSTPKGMLLELEDLGGFPLLVDEAHMASPEVLKAVTYNFANGQSYTRGTKEGHAHGGATLSGALLLAGELLPGFTNQGSRNRTLLIDAAEHPPLGPAATETLADRLNEAVLAGAGYWGREVAERMWNTLTKMRRAVLKEERAYLQAASDGREWVRALLVAKHALGVLFEVLALDTADFPEAAADFALTTLQSGRQQTDIYVDAFEAVRTLAVTARREGNVLVEYGAPIGKDLVNGSVALATTVERVRKALEPYGGLRGLAAEWARRGYITPASNGDSTKLHSLTGTGKVRCIEIPASVLELQRGGHAE